MMAKNQPQITTLITMETSVKQVFTRDIRKGLRQILLDPIKLFTVGELAHRKAGGTGSYWQEDPDWESGAFANKKRIYHSPSVTPYLDDTYRADDRYGPKSGSDAGNIIPSGSAVGDTITSDTSLTALDVSGGIYGLDGYWERRAIGQGLRVIVGQRLELGNSSGWEGSDEVIYPSNDGVATEVRQRRSLYDNLAAVQGMVVYHHESYGGRFPKACIASTVHPGTKSSIIKSRTFDEISVGGTTKINTDFFNGVGTNGWEFAFPYTNSSDFSSAILSNKPLGKVLRNLGTFAGDPLGGAPSFSPTQNDDIHPAPYMAAWGDFSNLRRILDSFDSGVAYGSLSPADQTTLHSAACTIGMLAYGLNNEIQLSSVDYGSVQALGNHIEKMINGGGSGANTDIDTYIGATASDGQPVIKSGAKARNGVGAGGWEDTINNSLPGSNYRPGCDLPSHLDITGSGDVYDPICDAADYYGQFTTEDFYRALDEKPGLGSALKAKFATAQAVLQRGSQIERDRSSGFRPGGLPSTSGASSIDWDGETGLVDTAVGGAQLVTGCDPDLFDASQAEDNVALALALCQSVSKDVKYPSLYYLFAPFPHDHNGNDDSSTIGVDHSQPSSEEYIADPYVSGKNTNGSESDYYAVTDADISAIATAFSPRATDFSGWVLPNPSSESVLSNPDSQPFTINVLGSGYNVSLLDKAMYDGREAMSIRMLDVDIKKLTTDTNVSDHWIADTDGIVYAFREDAAREDSIVRPKDTGTDWSDCDTWNEVYKDIYGGSGSSAAPVVTENGNCRLLKKGALVAGVLVPPSNPPFLQDPPLTDKKISTKPIDFYADPDRRPYGFRLLNGSTLNRAADVQSGMTFVSDNMVYIKGDFNLHTNAASGALGTTPSTACRELIEEFDNTPASLADTNDQRLVGNDCSKSEIDFYDDRTTNNDVNFANSAVDKWRPVEIVGDAVGVLSANFNDGSVEDTFVLEGKFDANNAYGVSSYQNQNRLVNDDAHAPGRYVTNRNGRVVDSTTGSMVAEDGSDSGMMKFDMTYGKYQKGRTADLQNAVRTVVNAVFISGIIPSQAGQSYGGMHNFPRLLEYWDTIDLHISGGFFQLNFSTSATGPYDPDAWEPGQNPVIGGNDRTVFYGAPNRIWGYDVGLQYAPAGPIARRFVTVDRPRSEFYRELPVDDEYVKNLRCAVYDGGTRVYPSETSCS